MKVTCQDDLHPGLNQPIPDVVGMIDDRRTDKTLGIRDMLVQRMMHHDKDFLASGCCCRSLLTYPVERLGGNRGILTGVDTDNHESAYWFTAVGLRHTIKQRPRAVAIIGIEAGKLLQ